MRAFLFLVFVATVAAHRHTLPRRLVAALPPATAEAGRQIRETASALWQAAFDPDWHDCG